MKKVVSLLLASALVLGMSTVSFAADKVTGYVAGTVETVLEYAGSTDKYAGDKIIFDDIDGTKLATAGGNMGANIQVKDLKAAKVTVKSNVKSGSKFIDKFELVNTSATKAAIQVTFVSPFVSTDDKEYDFTFYLVFDGKPNNTIKYHAAGDFKIKTTPVDADDDYVDLQDGQVADVGAYVKSIECDLGNGVSIFTKLYNGKKYFGVADSDVSEADDAMITKHPEIQNVITLTTIGLNAAGNIVKLNDYGSETYVYDKDLKYLGTANEMLPYSTKYYLTNVKLAEEAAEGEDGDAPTEGDDEAPSDVEAPSNTNDNPGTGR